MFSKRQEGRKNVVVDATELALALPDLARDAMKAEPIEQAAPVFCIGPGMSIRGKVQCNGPAQVFGRIEGEVRASEFVIGEGAQLEGSVIAREVTVYGRIKGTIHGVRVKLQDGGEVEGDIFARWLIVEENARFDGASRPLDDPTELPSTLAA
jgi:cytoskeletal protein CcmA (bactofilin family)